MTRHLSFDLESTGLDPFEDRIVSLALVEVRGGGAEAAELRGGPQRDLGLEPGPGRGGPAGGGHGPTPQLVFKSLVDPGVPIPPDATAVHGITDEMVASAPPFGVIAGAVQAEIEGAVLVGYNSRRFDTILLDRELRRAGQPGIDLFRVREIDVLGLWRVLEPRTLEGAVRRWLGVPQEAQERHDAARDAVATARVLLAMQEALGFSLEEAADLSRPEDEVDRTGRFRVDPDTGQVVFAFGRHRGEPVSDHPDYLDWMASADFGPLVVRAIEELRAVGFSWPPEGA